jgi:cytochrome c oxidase subunit 1/cytochrome c oxidase subunit I+III
MGWGPVNLVVTLGAYVLAVGVLLLLINILRSRRHGAAASENPWDAPSLEWATSSPPPPYNFAVLPTVASRSPLWEDRLKGHRGESATAEGFLLDDGRETIGTSALDATPDVILRMPGDSYAPFWLALLLALLCVGMLLHSWWLFGVMLFASFVATVCWLWPEDRLGQTMDIVHERRHRGGSDVVPAQAGTQRARTFSPRLRAGKTLGGNDRDATNHD